MAERFTADLLFILFVLLVAALLGFLIGWFLAKRRCERRITELEEEIESLRSRLRRIEDEKNELNAKIKLLEEENISLRDKNRQMDDEIASLKLTIDKLEKEIRLLALSGQEAKDAGTTEAAGVPLSAMTTEVPVTEFKPDDLKVVVGIGPKIARLLINRGITTWRALAEASPGYLRTILDEDGGERYRIHNPENWPHQARLLDEGRWDEIRRYTLQTMT
jgi:predicted flap endonuclease-1-like 5' DNA nuclease